MTDKTIGIIGVGLMGHGIALNIQKHGWPICILDHPGNQPTDDLLAKGATVYNTPAELATASDTIIICVTGSPQVESVLTDTDGLLDGITKGSVVIDCSTAIPASTIKLAALVEKAGSQFLDAPMTRTPKEAAEGRLNLIVGGNKSLYQEQLPLLQAYAENITYAGNVGAGHALKLIHNYVSLGFSTVLAEATATANKAGVEPTVLHEVLAKGGGAGVILDRMSPFLLEQEVGGFSFSLANSAKDLGYYTQMCSDLATHKKAAAAISEILITQVENGNGDAFVPQLIDLLNQTKI